VIAAVATGQIAGLGVYGYEAALRFLQQSIAGSENN
jgi:3-dehydroquinate dehydratase